LRDAHRYIDGWLVGYSGALGSIAGVLIVDYWIIRKTELDLRSLYTTNGKYSYVRGWNLAAVYATLAGSGLALAGAFVDALAPIYNFSWFVGFGVAAGLYYALMAKRRG
jgi:NCS1 family nucleobase:cation symporter-1